MLIEDICGIYAMMVMVPVVLFVVAIMLLGFTTTKDPKNHHPSAHDEFRNPDDTLKYLD